MRILGPETSETTNSTSEAHTAKGFRPYISLSRVALGIGLMLAIAVGTACSDNGSEAASQDAAATPTAATQDAAMATPTAGSSESDEAAETLSANNASIAELTAAFEAAGISNASKWAREVDEYRPYETDDTEYKKLRGELAKYNPAPGVVDAIVALLHLP